MSRWKKIPFNYRLAIVLLILVIGGNFALSFVPDSNDSAVQKANLFIGVIVVMAILFVLAVVSVGAIFFKPPSETSALSGLAYRFAPLCSLIFGLFAVHFIADAHADQHRLDFAKKHASELSGSAPKAAIYSEGIPDGGTAIIRSPDLNPTEFSSSVSNELTRGNITKCNRMNDQDWFCYFG